MSSLHVFLGFCFLWKHLRTPLDNVIYPTGCSSRVGPVSRELWRSRCALSGLHGTCDPCASLKVFTTWSGQTSWLYDCGPESLCGTSFTTTPVAWPNVVHKITLYRRKFELQCTSFQHGRRPRGPFAKLRVEPLLNFPR
ncbi:hypothetical protein EDB19DRAFT_1662036 [Suillus lakei]|nr:hypothetical protein EDB19DRAFT_1662036 [Suillus lakei]